MIIGLTLVLVVLAFNGIKKEVQTVEDNQKELTDSGFQLSSTAFAEGGMIPAKYTCQGANLSPPLNIAGTPQGTKALALIMHDPDAPAGDWVHWTVWNIADDITNIAENSLPVGAVEGPTSFGETGYGGPCPPSGTHHYIFELYALDSSLNLPTSTSRDELKTAIADHIIAETTLTGLFSN